MNKTSSTNLSKLNYNISRRQLLQLCLAFSGTVTIFFQFQQLSKDATVVLICLNAFNQKVGAKFEDLFSVVNHVSELNVTKVESIIDDLIRMKLIHQKVQGYQRILFISPTTQHFAQ